MDLQGCVRVVGSLGRADAVFAGVVVAETAAAVDDDEILEPCLECRFDRVGSPLECVAVERFRTVLLSDDAAAEL